jgi:hypothetical protein
LAGKKKERKLFTVHEIRRIDGEKVFQNNGKVYMLQIGGNKFYYQKNGIPIKILTGKRSGIEVIAEFRGIPSGFPNQVRQRLHPVRQ